MEFTYRLIVEFVIIKLVNYIESAQTIVHIGDPSMNKTNFDKGFFDLYSKSILERNQDEQDDDKEDEKTEGWMKKRVPTPEM